MKNVLLDKGIILPSGEISKDKVNLVTGAITHLDYRLYPNTSHIHPHMCG